MDFVMLSITPWKTQLPSSGHFLAQEFAHSHRVLFVNRQLTYKDWLLGSREKPGLEQASNGIWTLTPTPGMPINFLGDHALYRRLLDQNAQGMATEIQKAMQQLGLKDPLFWISFEVPMGLALVGKLQERLKIYHCFDEIRGEAYIARHGAKLEGELIPKCDLVITSSQALQTSRGLLHPNCHYIPNGVRHRHFAQALGDLTIPDELKDIPRPIVGYLGNIEARIDPDLLEYLLKERPYSLVLVGPISAQAQGWINRLKRYPHFHALGAKPYEQAPAYLKAFDAGIIPFVRSVFTSGVYPLKLNEYLSAGLPVVMTDFGCLESFHEVAWITKDQAAFLHSLDRAVCENRKNRLWRSDYAQQNDWSTRAKSILTLIEQTLQKEA